MTHENNSQLMLF